MALTGLPAAAAESDAPLTQLAQKLDASLFSSDGLAVPIATEPTPSKFAAGLDRILVLGGGGEYYVAWYCGFFHGLFDEGIDTPALAEMIVGTSAGSYAGSSMASGHFQRLRHEFEFFGHFPKLFAHLAPVTQPNASQERAQQINAAATDGSLATRQVIGHAALAADNRLDGSGVERLAALLTGDSKTDWPAAKMYTTAVDCYTGERIVVSQASARKNNIPLAHGAAASSSLPGIIGPTLLGQRYCMDGGICSNPAHVDIVAGSKRALIVTLNDGITPPFLTGIPHPLAENIRQLEASGTKALWIKADPPNVSLLDPKEIGPALRTGYDRAKQEAARIKDFWA